MNILRLNLPRSFPSLDLPSAQLSRQGLNLNNHPLSYPPPSYPLPYEYHSFEFNLTDSQYKHRQWLSLVISQNLSNKSESNKVALQTRFCFFYLLSRSETVDRPKVRQSDPSLDTYPSLVETHGVHIITLPYLNCPS